ncbi:hypothetical protein [Ferruginibacter profundus]
MNYYEWLYIIFISDFTDESQPDKVFQDTKKYLEQLSYSQRIKVVFIKNSFLTQRLLLKTDKRNEVKIINNSKKTKLFFCEITIYESESCNDNKLVIQKVKTSFNYWQKAFDFVFKNYTADNYVLHTSSHSNGFEINVTDEGFVMNGCGNLLTKKATFSAYKHQSAYFTEFLKRKNTGKKNPLFLRGLKKQGNENTKLFKKLNPKKLPLKKWASCNSSNGLLLYDFSKYLKETKIKFKFLFLQNCDTFLLENLYYLKDTANIIFGSTGNISKRLNSYEIIYLSIIQNECMEKIKMGMMNKLRKLMIDNNIFEDSLLMAETSNIDEVFTCISKIFQLLKTLYLKDKLFRNSRIPFLIPDPGLPISPISHDPNLQYYDVIELLKVFAGNNIDALNLIGGFENACNKNIIPLHTLSPHNFPSLLYPYKSRYSFLSHLRSLYRKPYSRFSDETYYNSLITALFFE